MLDRMSPPPPAAASAAPPPGSWVVLKFGGTSVSTVARWRCICEQVAENLRAEGSPRVWVTISALTQVTNKLTQALAAASRADASHASIVAAIARQHFSLAYEAGLFAAADAAAECEREGSAMEVHDRWERRWMASVLDESFVSPSAIDVAIPAELHPLLQELKSLARVLEGVKLTQEASPRIQARVLAFGELLSTHLGVCIMARLGLRGVTRVDARALLVSDSARAKSEEERFLQADVLPREDAAKAAALAGGARVVLTQGFIASTADGATCVLGRGGSDTSGALFAAMLCARKYEIWTDVHGLFTSDPRGVRDARLLTSLDYREAQELAAMGAKVLHPRCIMPAQAARVPVEIRNTNDPRGARTVIHPPAAAGEAAAGSGSPKILAVVKRQRVTTLSITALDMWGTAGFLSTVFAPFERGGISVDLIATSQFSVTVTLDHIPGGVDGAPFRQLLVELGAHSAVSVFQDCAVVSVVGRGLRKALPELGQALAMLEGYDVLLLSESAEDLNLSFVLQQPDADELVARMHALFFPPDAQHGGANSSSSSSSSSSSASANAGLAHPPLHPAGGLAGTAAIRRSPSRDALLGPSWQSLVAGASAGAP